MAKFGYLKKHDPGSTLREYRFTGIEGVPVLICLPATSWREDYEAAVRAINLRDSGAAAAREPKADEPVASSVSKVRRRIPTMVQHVVRGWRVAFDDGTPAPFTPENLAEFLEMLPDAHLAEFMAWVSDISNFESVFSVEAVAKNS